MTLSETVSGVEIKRGSAGEADETIFRRGRREEMLGKMWKGSSLGRARKRVGGISGGPLSRLIFTDRISPGRG